MASTRPGDPFRGPAVVEKVIRVKMDSTGDPFEGPTKVDNVIIVHYVACTE